MKKFNKKIKRLEISRRIIGNEECFILTASLKCTEVTLATYSTDKKRVLDFVPISSSIESNIINLGFENGDECQILVDKLIKLSRNFSKVVNIESITVDSSKTYNGDFVESVKFIDEKYDEQLAYKKTYNKVKEAELKVKLYSKKDLEKIEHAFLKKYENSKNFEQISKIFRDFLKEQYQISKYEKRQSAFIEPNIDSKIIRLS